MGIYGDHIVVFTTDNGAEAITFPDGGVTPFKGQKGEAWEGGYRAPQVVRWPGHIKPGRSRTNCSRPSTGCRHLSTSLAPKGDGLKKEIRLANIPASSNNARRL